MHFGENQLSRSLIGLSPLPTAHPLHFQLKWVRSSTRSYTRFNLAMGRSLRFGSRTRDSIALFRLAFATASPHGLTSPRITNSQAHSSKGTLSPHKEAPTVCRHMVSGTISLPSRGTFHHSLTVLIRYRSTGSIQAYQVVLADSHGISRAPCYSGTFTKRRNALQLRDSHPLRSGIQTCSSIRPHLTSTVRQNHHAKAHNPAHATPAGYHTHTVWPHPLSLATTHGITFVFSSCGY